MDHPHSGAPLSKRILLRAAFFVAVWLLAPVPTLAVALREVYSFPRTPSASATLVEGTDGAYYGTTFGGGSDGVGMVFRITTNGAFTTIMSFANTNGSGPRRTLAKGN